MKPLKGILLALCALLACGARADAPMRLAFGTPPQKTQPAPPADAGVGKPASAAERLLQSLLADRMTPQQERELGARVAGNILGVAPLVDDPALQRYVGLVGRWVAMQSGAGEIDWRFGVIDSEDVNAFAAPGGYILLTRGLYRRLNDEAELAGVLAHEIGHVVARHHLKLIRRTQLLAQLSGALLKEVPDEHERMQNIIGRGAEVAARSLDKTAEYEADRTALVLTARAGYDAFGLPRVLQDIGHFAAGDDRVALLFKTHPHPDDRLLRLGDAVGTRWDDLDVGKLLADRFYRLPPAP